MLDFKISARLTFVLGAVLGALIVYNFARQVETKVEVQEKEVVKTQVQTRIVHVKAPDGTERTETVTIGTSTEQRDSRLSLLQNKRAQYVVGVGVAAPLADFKAPEYSLLVSRRILGPLFVGVTASTDKTVGALVHFEF